MIESIYYFKILLTSLGTLKHIVFGFFIIKSLLSSMHTPIIKTWLNCCKDHWLYYADTKGIILVWFRFLICIANNTESLVNSLFGLKIFSPFLSFTFFSSPSSGGKSSFTVESSDSFWYHSS